MREDSNFAYLCTPKRCNEGNAKLSVNVVKLYYFFYKQIN